MTIFNTSECVGLTLITGILDGEPVWYATSSSTATTRNGETYQPGLISYSRSSIVLSSPRQWVNLIKCEHFILSTDTEPTFTFQRRVSTMSTLRGIQTLTLENIIWNVNLQSVQSRRRWQYRGENCGWDGANINVFNQRTSDPSEDVCAKTVEACQLRFGTDRALRYSEPPEGRQTTIRATRTESRVIPEGRRSRSIELNTNTELSKQEALKRVRKTFTNPDRVRDLRIDNISTRKRRYGTSRDFMEGSLVSTVRFSFFVRERTVNSTINELVTFQWRLEGFKINPIFGRVSNYITEVNLISDHYNDRYIGLLPNNTHSISGATVRNPPASLLTVGQMSLYWNSIEWYAAEILEGTNLTVEGVEIDIHTGSVSNDGTYTPPTTLPSNSDLRSSSPVRSWTRNPFLHALHLLHDIYSTPLTLIDLRSFYELASSNTSEVFDGIVDVENNPHQSLIDIFGNAAKYINGYQGWRLQYPTFDPVQIITKDDYQDYTETLSEYLPISLIGDQVGPNINGITKEAQGNTPFSQRWEGLTESTQRTVSTTIQSKKRYLIYDLDLVATSLTFGTSDNSFGMAAIPNETHQPLIIELKWGNGVARKALSRIRLSTGVRSTRVYEKDDSLLSAYNISNYQTDDFFISAVPVNGIVWPEQGSSWIEEVDEPINWRILESDSNGKILFRAEGENERNYLQNAVPIPSSTQGTQIPIDQWNLIDGVGLWDDSLG